MADASPDQEEGGDTGQQNAAQQDAANNKPEDSQAALVRAWRDAEHILPLVRHFMCVMLHIFFRCSL